MSRRSRYAALWVLLCLGALQVHAQIDVQLLCGDGAEVGASVQVTIAAAIPEATPLGAFDAVLSWDPDQLSFLSIADGDYGGLSANTGAIDAGRVNFNAFDAGGRAGEFSLAQLKFQRMEDAGESQVNLSFAEISAARTFADLLSQVDVAPCLVGESAPDAGSADEAIAIRFEGPAQVEAGTAVEWTLIAAIPTGTGIGAFDAVLRWNVESLRFLSIADGDYGGLSANTSRADAGQVNFNSFDSAGRQGAVSLAVFTFEAIGADNASVSLALEIAEISAAQTFEDLADRVAVEAFHFEIVRTATAPAPGDFDGDGIVGFNDFFMFADAFGGNDSTFDLNDNGLVDFADFFIFADRFGR